MVVADVSVVAATDKNKVVALLNIVDDISNVFLLDCTRVAFDTTTLVPLVVVGLHRCNCSGDFCIFFLPCCLVLFSKAGREEDFLIALNLDMN